MLELPLVFVAGMLGSSHCIGMCGPLAITMGSGAGRWPAIAVRQLVYTSGRVFTYAVFGAAAGFLGWQLQRSFGLLQNAAAVLALAAGALLLYQGLLAAGVLRRRVSTAAPSPCLGSPFLAAFLRSPAWTDVFLAGLFTGMLPCGLVYGFVALAASRGDILEGAALMIAFGLGTAPVMMLTGGSGALLGLAAQRRVYRIAAWCLVLTGAVTIVRGAGFLPLPGNHKPAGCPACATMVPESSASPPQTPAPGHAAAEP